MRVRDMREPPSRGTGEGHAATRSAPSDASAPTPAGAGCRAVRERRGEHTAAPRRAPRQRDVPADRPDSLPWMPETADRVDDARGVPPRRGRRSACAARSARPARRWSSATAALDADLMFVGEAPGYHEDRQGIPFVGASPASSSTGLLEGIGLQRDGRVHRQRPQVPPAGQPRPRAGRDPVLRAAPVPPDLAHPAAHGLHAGQLRDQAALGPAGRHLAGARARAADRGRRPPPAALPALPPGGGPLRARHALDARGRLRPHPRAARRPSAPAPARAPAPPPPPTAAAVPAAPAPPQEAPAAEDEQLGLF